MTKLSLIQLEQIKSEIVTSRAMTASNAKGSHGGKEGQARQARPGDCGSRRQSSSQVQQASSQQRTILWRADGSMITKNGIKCDPEENEFDLPFDMPKLVSDYKIELPDYLTPVQRGHCIEAIHPKTKVILREPMG